jgi:hypothetical protein
VGLFSRIKTEAVPTKQSANTGLCFQLTEGTRPDGLDTRLNQSDSLQAAASGPFQPGPGSGPGSGDAR